jgi:hypothetical protein
MAPREGRVSELDPISTETRSKSSFHTLILHRLAQLWPYSEIIITYEGILPTRVHQCSHSPAWQGMAKP